MADTPKTPHAPVEVKSTDGASQTLAANAPAAARPNPAPSAPARSAPAPAPAAKVAGQGAEKPVAPSQRAAPPAAKAPVKPARGQATTPAKARPNPAAVKAARRAARVEKAAQRPLTPKISPTQTTVKELKEKIMATNNTDFAQPINQAIGDIQNRTRAAYEKGTEVATEVTEFAKGNVDAVVESTKIFANGAQSLGKTYVEEAKSAYETITSDVKELAAVKSPAELFQLQGKILRRNLETFVATTSRNGEAVLKLANDTFAPFTGRVNVAAEKMNKVA